MYVDVFKNELIVLFLVDQFTVITSTILSLRSFSKLYGLMANDIRTYVPVCKFMCETGKPKLGMKILLYI